MSCVIAGWCNSVKSGRMLEIVQEMLPDAGVTELCLNRDVTCQPHRDRGNSSDSHILYFGDFQGGALCLEDERRYEAKNVWHGPFDGKRLTHWNEPHVGTMYAVVAYSRARRAPRSSAELLLQ